MTSSDHISLYLYPSTTQLRLVYPQFAKAHGKTEGEQQAKPQEGSKRAGMGALLEGPPKAKLYAAVTATEK